MAAIVWAVVVATGAGLMMRYGLTRGAAATAAPASVAAVSDGADGSVIQHPGRPLLLVFAHPKCPCTRATLAELDRLLARVTVRPDVTVLFTRPAGAAEGWEQGDLWQSASRLPGVSVRVDMNGALAARFGAATSGQVLLYDAAGRLAFAGGITAARGHAGDNSGSDAIAALLSSAPAQEHPSVAHTPVFGCALSDRIASSGTAQSGKAQGDLDSDRSLTCHQ